MMKIHASFSCTGLLMCLFFSTGSFAQETYHRIAFYNQENLFDYENDSLIKDEEYLPEGKRHWDQYRYREKSNRMAKAILSIGEWQAPDIVGVCEVENRRVLEDLVHNEVLKKLNYGIVHYDSPDRRGIDVGLLYRKDRVKVHYSKPVQVKNTEDISFKTRDILYVKLSIAGDTLHLFVNHWPSRYGGQQQSEPKRILAANTLRTVVDSLQAHQKQSKIIIMGDLNDSPENLSVKQYLKAVKNPDEQGELKNLMQELPVNEGSHRYKGEWSYLDQIIVSQVLLRQEEIRGNQAFVHRPDFLLEVDERYPGKKPFRTFIGLRYQKGFSDHLPVYIDLVLKDKATTQPKQ